jgi:hypothetical protein
MIKDHKGVQKKKIEVRYLKIILCGAGKAFKKMDGIISDHPHGPPCIKREPVDSGHGGLLNKTAQFLKGVPLDLFLIDPFGYLYLLVFALEDTKRTGPDDGIPSDPRDPLDRLQQEGVPALTDPFKYRRRIEIFNRDLQAQGHRGRAL